MPDASLFTYRSVPLRIPFHAAIMLFMPTNRAADGGDCRRRDDDGLPSLASPMELKCRYYIGIVHVWRCFVACLLLFV